MKNQFIASFYTEDACGTRADTVGWIRSVRKYKNIVFVELTDSTGSIQVTVDPRLARGDLRAEQSVSVQGLLQKSKNGRMEIVAENIRIIGDVKRTLRPNPRKDFDIFDAKYTNYVQSNRHLFIRNPKVMAALRARDLVKKAVHHWFEENRFIEITAPILTPVLLYERETGIAVNVNDQDVFLTQCVAFYLESAVHAFERVYNIGPSFRGAESVSPRHLTEYWHVKAEIANCSFEEMFSVIESMIASIAEEVAPLSGEICKALGVQPVFAEAQKRPFPRITYRDAVALCQKNGIDAEFGKSLGGKAEEFLARRFGSPVWVTHNARSIEGFPYKICEFDEELTYTADLIGSCGGGEILGIADKITDRNELQKRLKEKGKAGDAQYEWFSELRDYGTVPHCGVGMGLERLIKWLYCLPHVREAIPFPRSMGRKIYP